MAWRSIEAWQEMQKSLCGVAEQQLCSERSLTRVRLPSIFQEESIWINFMGRGCFCDAAAFVTSLAPGSRGCIRGLHGCGKTFLLATLAAFLTTQNRCKAVYLCGPLFRSMPLIVLQSNLAVAFGGDKAVVNEIMDLNSRDCVVQWIKNRPEKLCFMLDEDTKPDRAVERKRVAMDLLKDVTEGRVLVCCARAGASPDCGVANAFFDMPETFDGEEVKWFAQHAGKLPMDGNVWHLTRFSPLLLKFYYRGDLPLVLTQYAKGVDNALSKLGKGPASAWRPALEALAGFELESGESQLKELNNVANGHFLYKNKNERCGCLCEPLRRHACLRAIQGATLGMEEVLEIWLAPLLAEEYYGEPPFVAPWNCTLAVATVLRLRDSVWLAPVGEKIVTEIVSARNRWWTGLWDSTVYLDSDPSTAVWPVISAVMYHKAFVLQAGILDDLNPEQMYDNKQKFLLRVKEKEPLGGPCYTYFVWIGCFGNCVSDGVAIHYDNHADVFLNYGQLDPLLSPLETKFQKPVGRTLDCHYMVGKCKCSAPALADSILCSKHSSCNSSCNRFRRSERIRLQKLKGKEIN